MTDLLVLQNQLKRAPDAYREEFLQQARHFLSNLQIFKSLQLSRAGQSTIQTSAVTADGKASKSAQKDAPTPTPSPLGYGIQQTRRIQEFCALIAFLSQTCALYPTETKNLNIVGELFSLLSTAPDALDALLRKTLTQSLILLQKKGLVSRLDLYNVLFSIFRCNDRELRNTTFSHLVTDLLKLSKTAPSVTLTSQLQSLVFGHMKSENTAIALKATHVLVELWKKNVWVSDRVVNQIGSMIFTTTDKLISAALYFFLGDYDTAAQEEREKKEETLSKNKEISILKYSMKHMKKKMKKQRIIERTKKAVARAQKDLEDWDDEENAKDGNSANINPLLYLHDPQHFAERLFYKLKVSKETFQTRMLLMDVLSKCIGQHKLLLFNFYPFLQRYLQPHQREVTVLLSFVIRATHNLVPPEVLSPVIKTIANGFVNDKSGPEVITVGINSIREICSRAPLVMTEDLLHDLVEYKGHKNKGIMSATRSLLNVFRELNPMLLRRRDRGKEAAVKLAAMNSEDGVVDKAKHLTNLEYGGEYRHRDVIGSNLLYEAGLLGNKNQDNADSDEWEEDYDFMADLPPENYGEDGDGDEDEDDDDDDDDEEEGEGDFDWDEWQVDEDAEAEEDGDAEGDSLDSLMGLFGGEGEAGEGEGGMDMMDFFGEGENDDEEGMNLDLDEMAALEALVNEEEEAEQIDHDDDDDDEIKSTTKKSKKNPIQKDNDENDDEGMKLVQIAGLSPAPTVPFAALRILTPADFKKIEVLKQRKRAEKLRGNKVRKEMLLEDIEDQDERLQAFKEQSYVDVDEDELNSARVRKQRMEKVERVKMMREHKQALRTGGVGNNNQVAARAVTTEEKSKNKAYGMVKHSRKVKYKSVMAFKQKQAKVSSHVKSLKNMRKNLRKKVSKASRK
jgi:protein SDA1